MRAHGVAMEQEFSSKIAALVAKHQEDEKRSAQSASQALQSCEQTADKKQRQAIKDLETAWLGKLEAAEREHMESIKTLRAQFEEMRERELEEFKRAAEEDKAARLESLREQLGSTTQEITRAHELALLQANQRHTEELQKFAAAAEEHSKQAARELAEGHAAELQAIAAEHTELPIPDDAGQGIALKRK